MLPSGVDLETTECFLLSQPDVLNASVWVEKGRVLAHVTVFEETNVTNRTLLNACKKELGLRLAPAEILLMRAKQKAA